MSYLHNTIFVHSKKEVPEGEHYAILIFGQINIPGDERSRTHPGHGYPAHMVSNIEYRAFTKKEDWEAEIVSMEKDPHHKKYIATKIKPATTTVKVEVQE